jgi:hypothetical protein
MLVDNMRDRLFLTLSSTCRISIFFKPQK